MQKEYLFICIEISTIVVAVLKTMICITSNSYSFYP